MVGSITDTIKLDTRHGNALKKVALSYEAQERNRDFPTGMIGHRVSLDWIRAKQTGGFAAAWTTTPAPDTYLQVLYNKRSHPKMYIAYKRVNTVEPGGM